jgi:hypothetical protein
MNVSEEDLIMQIPLLFQTTSVSSCIWSRVVVGLTTSRPTRSLALFIRKKGDIPINPNRPSTDPKICYQPLFHLSPLHRTSAEYGIGMESS